MGVLLASSIVSPIIAGKRKLAGWVNFLLCLAAGIIFLNISLSVIFSGVDQGTRLVSLGLFEVYFLIDGFSALFLCIISFMSVLAAFYSIEYMEHYSDYSVMGYYINFPIFIMGMAGVVTVDDLSTGFTIAWQLMTITSFLLIRFDNRDKVVVKSANKYLMLMELAWALILAGTLFIDNIAPGDSLHQITQKLSATSGWAIYAIFGLILLGFGLKAGVFPLGQLWLPDAHSVAPSPISALLSGVMIKTGVYGIIRTLFWMVPESEAFHFSGQFWGALVAAVGVVTLFIGTVQCLKQHDAKRLLAYSSIGQMGYIILGIGSALFMFYSQSTFVKLLSVIAIIGTVYHTLNHAVFKGLLFFSIGSVQYATGMKNLNKLGGLIKLMPISAVLAGIASISIAGVPALSGFMSKWTIISSNILAGSEVMFMAIFGIIALMTSAITLACYVQFFGMTYTATGTQWNTKKEIKEVPAIMLIPKIILGALCIVQGLIPYFYFQTFISIFKNSKGSIITGLFNDVSLNNLIFSSAMGIEVSLPGSRVLASSIAVPAVLIAVFAIAFVLAYLLRKSGGSTDRVEPVWMCGYQGLNEKTRYKSKSMYSAFKNFLKWTGGNVRE